MKFLLSLSLSALLIFCNSALFSQGCDNTTNLFSATLDPSKTFIANDWGIEGIWNRDNEYVVLGIKDDKNSASKFSLFFQRFDETGDPMQATSIEFPSNDYSFHQALLKTTHITQIIENGNLVGYGVAATIRRSSVDATRIVIFRLDTDGCVVWMQERTVTNSPSENEIAKDIIQDQSGNLIVLISSSEKTAILTEITAAGSFSQTHEYRVPGSELLPSSFAEVSSSTFPDLQYIITGYLNGSVFVLPIKFNFSLLNDQLQLIDLDDNSQTEEFAQTVTSSINESIVISGYRQDRNQNQSPFALNMSLNMGGNGNFGTVNYINEYVLNNQTNRQFALDMVTNGQGEVYISGYTIQQGNEPASFIMKTNSSGSEQWAKNYEEQGESGYFISLAQVSDGGIFAVGGKWNSLENRRAFLMKADDDGELCNCYSDINVNGSSLSSSSTQINVQILRPDWLFGFPTTECSDINVPQRFCEQSLAQGPEVEFIIPKMSIECDTSDFCMELTVRDFDNVIGTSFSISWDPNNSQYSSSRTLAASFSSGSSFDESQVNNGRLGFQWSKIFSPEVGASILNNQPIIEVCFNVVNNQIGIEQFNFTDSPTPRSIDIVNEENERFRSSDGFLTNDCERDCNAFFFANIIESCGEVQFMNQSISTGLINSVSWEFGDGNVSTELTPTHIYDQSGNYTVQLTVVDSENCTDTYVEAIDVTIDNASPEIVCPDAIFIECSKSRSPENTGFATVTDNCGDENVNLIFQDEVLVDGNCSSILRRTWIASDQTGNVETCEQIISIVDRTGPVLSNCPAPITVNSVENSCGALVQVPVPTVSDDCNQTMSFVNDFTNSSDASSTYPAGTTVVTWTATDECGNSSTCQTTIEVLDVMPPTVECLDDIVVSTNSSAAGLEVSFPDPMITDDCGATLVFSRESGSFFLCGTTTVSYFAVDAAGNESAVCVFNVTVECGDVSCCVSQSSFDNKVNAGFTSVVDSNAIYISPLQLNGCHEVLYDWGDGFSTPALPGDASANHVYRFPGEYTICAQVKELDDNGESCFQTVTCIDVCIAFQGCEDPVLTNLRGYGLGSSGFDQAQVITTDSNGDIYVSGVFSGSVDFGGVFKNTLGNQDIFLAKYDGDTGELIWVSQIGGSAHETSTAIAVDAGGNILLAGGFNSESTTFFSSPLSGGPSTTLQNDNIICADNAQGCNSDAFLAKYTPDGSLDWVFGFGEQQEDIIAGLTIDSEGNLLVTGYFSLQVDFDPGTEEFNLSGGTRDAFVAKYNSDGGFIWALDIGGAQTANPDEGTSVTTDPNGNVYVTGYFTGQDVDFDPVDGRETLLSAGADPSQKEIFVARYDADGDLIWAYDIGNTASTRENTGMDIEFANNQIFLIGQFNGSEPTDFDPREGATSENLLALTSSDVFVASYRNNFELLWAFNLGCDGFGYDLEVTRDGLLYITGSFSNTFVDFNPEENTNALLSNNGGSDIFLAKYTQGGQYLSAINPSSSNNDVGMDISAGEGEVLLLAGGFSEQGLLPDPTKQSTILGNAGDSDVFWGAYDCICLPPETCRTNCDFVNVGYELTANPQDSCCFDILFDNLAANYFTSIKLTAIEGVRFQSASLIEDDWSLESISQDSLTITPNGDFIPTGNQAPLTICLDDYTSTTQEVLVELLDTEGITCVDTLAFTCDPPAIEQCFEIVSDTAYCDGDDFIYEADWVNAGTFPIATLTIGDLSIDGATVEPDEYLYDPAIANDGGNTTGSVTFRFKGLRPTDDLCFSLVGEDESGRSTCITDMVCPPGIDAVCDLCRYTDLFLTANGQFDGNTCCFTLDLANDYQDGFFRSVRTDLLGDLQFSYQSTESDWKFETSASTDTATWTPLDNSPLPLDTVRSKINFCISGYQESGPNQMVVNWLSNGNNPVCTDTLDLSCSSPISTNCISVNSSSIACSAEGFHEIDLKLLNESGFEANRLRISQLSTTGSGTFAQPAESFTTTSVIGDQMEYDLPLITLENATAGDSVCLQIVLSEELPGRTQQVCYTEEICIVLPDCQSCSCQPWQGITISDPLGQWPDISNIACGDSLALPICAYEFCIDAGFACMGNDCDAELSWLLTRQNQSGATVGADTISGSTVDRCFDLSPDALPVGLTGPGVYNLELVGRCGIRDCNNCSVKIAVICDVDCAPEISCPDDVHLPCFGPADLPAPTFTDTCGNRTFTCTRDDGRLMNMPFLQDTTCITCIVQNTNGLTDSCSYKVIVDNTAPLEITCPPDQTLELAVGETSAIVTFPDPGISNSCNVTWSYDRASGELFDCGTTMVTCTAIDTLLQDTVRCTFAVELVCKRTTNCDSLIINYERDRSEPDSCCYFVSIWNDFEEGRYTGLRVKAGLPTQIISLETFAGWRAEREPGDTSYIITPPDRYIPKSNLDRLFKICTDGFTTNLHTVDLEWLEEVDGEEITLCPVLLSFDCETTKCCIDQSNFEARANAVQFNPVYADCKISITAAGMGECDEVYYDWFGNGILDGPYLEGETAVQVYAQPGQYQVCYSIIEVNRKGETCWLAVTGCFNQTAGCEDICCADTDDFRRRVNSGYTFQLENCRLTVTPNELNECNLVRWDWGDGSPVSEATMGNMPSFHFFDGPGTYTVCMNVEEFDENGEMCFSEEQSCMEFIIDCQPTCSCGAFDNIRFGQPADLQTWTCGLEPQAISCPFQNMDFLLQANFGCEGNCIAEQVNLEIRRNGALISTSTAMLNGNVLEAQFSYSLFSEPGTYSIEMSSSCDGKACNCAIQFIVPQECDCECGAFNGLVIDQDGNEFMLECNDTPIEIEPCVGEDLLLNGFFECQGTACTTNQLTWTLITSTGTTISNSLPTGSFQLSFNTALIEIPGEYRLEISAMCGVNSCMCTLVWEQPFCEICPCPVTTPEVSFEQQCNQVQFLFGGLDECDVISIDFGDGTGDVIDVGEPLTHWFMEVGEYNVVYQVERTETTGATCTIMDSLMVSVDCTLAFSTEENIVANDGYLESGTDGPLNWNILDAQIVSYPDVGSGCANDRYIRVRLGGINQTDELRLLSQSEVLFNAGKSYQIGVCLRSNSELALSDLSSFPRFQLFASESPDNIPSLVECGGDCALIAEFHKVVTRGQWITMRFDDWTADRDYRYLVLQVPNTIDLRNHDIRIDNISISEIITTSNKNTESERRITVYPNPSSEHVYVEFSKALEQNMQLKLVNILGQVTVEQQIPANENRSRLEIAHLTSGVYLLQIFDQEGNLQHIEKVLHKQPE